MKTFSLITVRGRKIAGLQPIVGGEEGGAIAFSFGMLTERIAGHGEMFHHLGVEWLLEEGVRLPHEIDLPAGREIGRWKLTGSASDPDLAWFTFQSECREGAPNKPA